MLLLCGIESWHFIGQLLAAPCTFSTQRLTSSKPGQTFISDLHQAASWQIPTLAPQQLQHVKEYTSFLRYSFL
jgi:hypothetical protein